MINYFKKNMVPIVFASMVVITSMIAFSSNFFSFTIPVLFAVTLSFQLCDFVSKNNIIGTIFYVVLSFVIIGFVTINNATSGMEFSFFVWLFSGMLTIDQFSYFLSFFILSTFFIGSAVYYFSYAIFKPFYFILLMYFPFILNTRRYNNINFLIVGVLIISLIILIAYLENIFYVEENVEFNDIAFSKRTLPFFLILAIPIFLVSSVQTPFKELPGIRSEIDIPAFTDKQETSGNTSSSRTNRSIHLFNWRSDEPTYLVKQIFSSYNSVWHYWHAYEREISLKDYDWKDHNYYINFNTFFENLDVAYDEIFVDSTTAPSKESIDKLKNIESIKTSSIENKIITNYLLSPQRSFDIDFINKYVSFEKIPSGETVITGPNDRVEPGDKYYITHYDDNLLKNNTDLQDFINQYSMSEYEDLLKKLNSNEVLSVEGYTDIGKYLQAEFDFARKYDDNAKLGQSPEIQKLADEITSGLTSDYEKAAAIVEYFHNTGYVYDLEYNPPEGREDIEYFIFDSKRGTCFRFATAMTLIARHAGLNARYVEGFISYEDSGDGVYPIRVGNSHAFTQIFVPIYGWVNFEPTVPSYFEDTEKLNQPFRNIRSISKFFRIFTIIIIILSSIYLFYIVVIKEYLFRKDVKSSNNKDYILKIYERCILIIEQVFGISNITSEMLVRIANLEYDIDLRPIAILYDRSEFNAETITKAELDNAFDLYTEFYKEWFKNSKKQKIDFNRIKQ